jgi:hypothetical protein
MECLNFNNARGHHLLVSIHPYESSRALEKFQIQNHSQLETCDVEKVTRETL